MGSFSMTTAQITHCTTKMFKIFLPLFSIFYSYVSGHGRLMDPPARNCMWRFGFINPVDYNDNEVFCGGVSKQFQNNGGRCGICGDSAEKPSPQDHETGGIYGNKIIGKTYVKNSVIDIEVELTANHRGRFSLKLCPLTKRMNEATQECLDQHPLTQLDGEDEFPIFETKMKATLHMKARLPQNVICKRCVLQWTWTSANSWGVCSNGTQGLGCGAQETFRNCADIRIVRSKFQLPATDNPRAIMIRDASAKSGQRPLVVRSQVCVATARTLALFGPSMSTWCQHNCLFYPPNCPQELCACLDHCTPAQNSQLTEFECNKRCLRYPHDEQCPEQCNCVSHAGENYDTLDESVIDARDGEGKLKPLLYNKLYSLPYFPWVTTTSYLYKTPIALLNTLK